MRRLKELIASLPSTEPIIIKTATTTSAKTPYFALRCDKCPRLSAVSTAPIVGGDEIGGDVMFVANAQQGSSLRVVAVFQRFILPAGYFVLLYFTITIPPTTALTPFKRSRQRPITRILVSLIGHKHLIAQDAAVALQTVIPSQGR